MIADRNDRGPGEDLGARAAEEIQAEQTRLAVFTADLATALTSNEPLAEILRASAQSVVDHLGAAFARIWTLNEKDNVLELQASAGLYTHLDGAHSRVPVGKFKIGLIAEERLPHLTNDVLRDDRVSDQGWAKREGMRAFAGYPLLVGDRLIGVLALFAREPLTEFTLKALETVAGSLALGIVRKRAEDALRLAHEQLEVKVRERTEELLRANQKLQQEIAERQQIETALRREKGFSDTTIDSLPGVFYLFDEQGRFLRWNQNFERVTGYSAEEIAQLHPLDLFVGDDKGLIEKRIKDSFVQGEATAEAELVNKRGDKVPYFFTGRRAMVGQAHCLIGMGIDITDRKRAEESLRQQAEMLKQQAHMLELSPVLVRDLEGRLLVWNEGAVRLYGWRPEEALGQMKHVLLKTQFPKPLKEIENEVISQGRWEGELTHTRRDGTCITVISHWTLHRDEQGQPAAIVMMNTDITEKRKLEAQYLRAQRMESIGILAGGIAHDLNNMLSPITMAVELLKLRLKDKDSLSLLENLRSSAARGADMVKQILLFARGVEGQHGVLQLKHVVKDVEHMLRHTFQKSIEVQFSVPKDLWPISGDATQLHQVLLNLCVNARDAMPHGGSLTVVAENVVLDEQYTRMNLEARPGRYVFVRVADTGTGIPAEIRDKIFDPFFTTKEVGKGTGLGLSTVLGIVKSHGGFVNVYSEVGKGTQFSVYLPAVDTGIAVVENTRTTLPTGNGEVILVVDDEAAIREITRATLEAHGYRVVTAADGAQAVAQYAQHKDEVQAVVTDMMMPVMDGVATIRALQTMTPTVRVIAVSGLTDRSKAVEVATAGVQAFLTKPFTAAALLQTLRDVLTGK